MIGVAKRKQIFSGAALLVLLIAFFAPPGSKSLAQAPTVDIPTVTSSPSGPIATVKEDAGQNQINVRSGPATYYDKVGVLLANQQVPAKGRSAGGDWILIDYPGAPGGTAWVYAPLINLTPGSLPVVAPPPTPTPLATATIDPTLAAQFVITMEPTRLPTFTEPPPLVIPTFLASSSTGTSGGVPMGLIIIGLASLGILIGIFTLAQGG